MKEELFRKKSLDKVKSPESLDDYIRVSNPGVWLLLAGIIALLLGACVWGIFGRVDSTVPATVLVEDGKAVCYLSEENITSARTGLTVRFADTEAVIVSVGEWGEPCALEAELDLPDGYYEAVVVVESFKPLSFILN